MDKSADTEAGSNEVKEAGRFRTILPQVLASTAKNLLLLDLGLSVAFPTIVIPALRGTVENYNETLYFTDEQASWFGSIPLICQPIGSVLSGWVSEPLGRKKAMIIVNIPHIIGWIILHKSYSIELMYLGAVLLGFGIGFMEAPIITYVGEISQPSIRGVLISCAGISVTLGIFIVYWLGSITTWRIAALICLSVPLVTVVAICFVPETPMWLLSKHKNEQALKSLQWLRGWVSPKAVEKEYQEMQRYSENSNKCQSCQKSNIKCEHPLPTIFDKCKELKRKRTVKAFIVVMGLFTIGQFSGVLAMRPFMVQIFKAYNVPMDPRIATVYIGVIALFANIACMSTIRLLGKRRICLIGLIGSLICCLALASYAQNVFPKNYNSFDTHENIPFESSYFPLVAFYFLAFWTNGGVTSIPWFMLSEVFPFKSRGLASGICAALNYLLGFITTKTYLNLDKGLSLNGTMWFYSIVNLIGLVFVYFILPETENRTLEDIEYHFSDNDRKLTDIKIAKNAIKETNGNRNNNLEKTVIKNGTKIDENAQQQENNKNNDGCDNKAFSNE
ncbi:facilitated trehalose transporter Tret1-like isoform X2 [Condylostylus longicornis]|nr:facilitated trehalose transporter Tret1-like isoform X2 [Condylostylus longicornis]